MTSEGVEVSRSGGVVTVTLDSPETRNGMTLKSWERLGTVLREVSVSTEDRVLLLTGANGTFCSGARLTPRGDGEPIPSPLARMDVVNDACKVLHDLRQPTVAVVSGYAVGAGFSLAIGCDLVIADDTARFSAMFVKRGLSIDCGGSWSLVNRIGLHRAKELALFGRTLSAREAQELGLVNRVVRPEGLGDSVTEWTQELLALPPIALAQNKRLLDRATSGGFDDALAREAAAQQLNSTTDDTREAISSFIEKRTPTYRGR
ncbi:enoyl-CoA hydratase/isomerase family protein [Ornithinimicrobium faecis]|uniref:enoyl-CoA hydratase/isomerase family protein n=1 Tax=Ornithinimicrobium faecis TaxID=2934158 RepID=UPI002117364C|nr:enoyl-CoA hydratase-related protein [Ornithinimicrobium sp. HY1745]